MLRAGDRFVAQVFRAPSCFARSVGPAAIPSRTMRGVRSPSSRLLPPWMPPASSVPWPFGSKPHGDSGDSFDGDIGDSFDGDSRDSFDGDTVDSRRLDGEAARWLGGDDARRWRSLLLRAAAGLGAIAVATCVWTCVLTSALTYELFSDAAGLDAIAVTALSRADVMAAVAVRVVGLKVAGLRDCGAGVVGGRGVGHGATFRLCARHKAHCPCCCKWSGVKAVSNEH